MSNLKATRVIAVTSGKGGVGKTNVSVNLALALQDAGQQVLLMDADLGLANIDVMFGLKPLHNLSHVIAGEKTLNEVIIDAPGGLKIIPASSGVRKMAELSAAEHAGLVHAFSEISCPIDVLIIDTAAGIAEGVTSFARAAQEVVVVVCNEPASMTDAYALIKLLNRDYDIRRFRILANMVHDPQEGKQLFSNMVRVSERFLDVTLDYMGAISFDDCFRKALRKRQPVYLASPRSRVTQQFKNLARTVDGWVMPSQASGHIEFFLEKLLHGNNGAGG